MLKLEDLQVDTHVAGIEPSVPVKILYVKKAGDDAADVTYELLDGRVLKKTLFRADEAELSVASETRAWAFDAKPESFKLAAEATRIKLAHLFDPMMAVHTSDVEPLPHQISAVYEAMLPKQPLRLVLADDPGAGDVLERDAQDVLMSGVDKKWDFPNLWEHVALIVFGYAKTSAMKVLGG